MRAYSFDSITINRREIKLDQILGGTTAPLSAFEESTFSFIQKWFGNSDSFSQKTSGSTGEPKNILITRQQMIASAKMTAKALRLEPGESALLCLDPEYIAGKMMMVRSFVSQMKIVGVDPASNPFSSIAWDVPIDFTAIVPLQLKEILQSEYANKVNSVRNILVGGAALDEGIQRKLAQFNNSIYATYGMTETISHIALQLINGPAASEYFTALPGIKISLDNRGCLEINAPYLSEKIVTNDLAEIDGSGNFKWLGRIDNVINSGGVKLIPEKIESQIRTLFEQRNISNKFLISSRRDASLGNKVILLIEGDLTMNLSEMLKSDLKKVLSPYEVPREIYTNIRMVLTENGKINRVETTRQIGN